MRRIWTQEERQFLKDNFANSYTQTIADKMNRSYLSVATQANLMRLHKSEAFKAIENENRNQKLKDLGAQFRFKKGAIPPNKGKKMSAEVYEKSKHKFFKPGRNPHNALQIGAEVIRHDKRINISYILIKLEGERKLKYKHVHIWEAVNKTKLPKGFNIVFKDGNTLNCEIDNLECISNAELMQRNTIHRFPEELKSTIRLVNKLKRKIENGNKK
jgi:hypothetical protein